MKVSFKVPEAMEAGPSNSRKKLHRSSPKSRSAVMTSAGGSKCAPKLSAVNKQKKRVRGKHRLRFSIRKRGRCYMFIKLRHKQPDEFYRKCLGSCYKSNEDIRQMRDKMKVLSLNTMKSARFPH
ncbi:hypothetical protein V3C99_000004 [Haemonchus contortus]